MISQSLSLLARVSVRHVLLGIVVVVIVGAVALRGGAPTAPAADEPETTLPTVTLGTANSGLDARSTELLGTARAIAEASITPERSGRVVAVNVSLGDPVGAGTVIARLENSSERAAVLQAEGAYEAAVAGAAQSGVGVEEAETALARARQSAVSAYQGSYTTANDIVRNSIDQFFTQPNAQIPGLQLEGRGYTSELNAERVALADLLPEWQADAQSLTVSDDLDAALNEALERTRRILSMVDIFITILDDQSNGGRYSDAELRQFSSSFSGLRSNLLGTITSLENAESSLDSAEEGLAKAELGGGDSGVSAADAQVKQALGSLRAAQANLEKTILRSPISGTVNAISVRTGDFVTANASVATVANNAALEITAYVSERQIDQIAIGDELEIAAGGSATVRAIAPAVDRTTGKREVRLLAETDTVAAGDTVTIVLDSDTATDASGRTTEGPLRVPLTAVKFEAEDGYVFTVRNGALERNDVTLGTVSGARVEVLDGLDADTEFVLDARGLNIGDEVTVTGT